MQVARVGLVNAVIRFDVDAGSDFVSFAVPTIMGEVRRHFRDNSWSVKVPRRLKELHLRLGRGDRGSLAAAGSRADALEFAAELEMDRDEVVEGLVAGSSYNTLSIDGGAAAPRTRPRSPTRSVTLILNLDQIENREALRPLLARCRSASVPCCPAVLRVDDADSDRRAGRHLADARVPLVG